MSWLTILGLIALGVVLGITAFYTIMMLAFFGVFGSWRR